MMTKRDYRLERRRAQVLEGWTMAEPEESEQPIVDWEYRQLCYAMLRQAKKDLGRGLNVSTTSSWKDRDATRLEARRWVQGASGVGMSFRICCEALALHPEQVRRRLLACGASAG